MMRRCILEFLSGRSVRRVPRQSITQQTPYFLSARKEFSVKSNNHNAPQRPYGSTGKPPESPQRPSGSTGKPSQSGSGSTGKPPESGSHLTKFVVGSVAIGAAVVAAYQTGYLGQGNDKGHKDELLPLGSSNIDDKVLKGIGGLGEQVVAPNNQEPSRLNPDSSHVEKKEEAHLNVSHVHEPSETEGESQDPNNSGVAPEDDKIPAQQIDIPVFSQGSLTSEILNTISETEGESQDPNNSRVAAEEDKTPGQQIDIPVFAQGSLTSDILNTMSETSTQDSANEDKTRSSSTQETETKAISKEIESKATSPHHLSTDDNPKGPVTNDAEPPSSLLGEYFLPKDEGSPEMSIDAEGAAGSTDSSVPFSEKREALGGMDEKDAYISKDGKLVLDFLQAIHAAEKEQAELDARIYSEEKRMLKEKYEKELKDARARQLMYAEEAAILDKELNKERTKAAAMIKQLQEKAEENLKMELERKENEAELELKKIQDLAKAELAAAIASEKASQIEKMADANLHINALCMAFYARSEEARQSHSVHKLALGALALEDALSKGLPIQSEIKALHTHLEGIDKDSLLDLVLSSLPEEILKYGTDTQLQLNQKFDNLKGTLRHYSLIPLGGGGILAHTLAHIASGLKVREGDQSGEGIESIINRVDNLLVDGKLAEAADALEGGVSGSQAEEIIGDWVRQARNRAITEQALSMLQSYATSISLT